MKFLNIICRLKEYFLDFYFTKKLWSIDSAKMTNYIFFFFFLFFPINLYRQLTTIVNKIRYMQATDVSENKLTRKKKASTVYYGTSIISYSLI